MLSSRLIGWKDPSGVGIRHSVAAGADIEVPDDYGQKLITARQATKATGDAELMDELAHPGIRVRFPRRSGASPIGSAAKA